ncbi:terpenoid synthase [Auriculariales sp. MPI-PUGE-AT-0066]|nr:terpenoid synthase [Auriculariales sp. MPI-PUGE-AT-0066]
MAESSNNHPSSLTIARNDTNSLQTATPPTELSCTVHGIIPGFVPDVLFIPRTLDAWPWPRAINPGYEEAKCDSNAWFYKFNLFPPDALHAFNKCDFARLASLAFPKVSKGCDLMDVFFSIDEYTDMQSEKTVSDIIDIVRDALDNPDKPRPGGEILLGQVVKEFWQRAILNSTAASQKHFISTFRDYLAAVTLQAGDRDSNYIRTVDEYFHMRRKNAGTRPSFFPGAMDLELPDNIWYHSLVVELEYHAADMIILDNDIQSYNKEQASDDTNCNIVTILMHHLQTDYTGAAEWIARQHAELEHKFHSLAQELPELLHQSGVVVTPCIQDQLARYVDLVGNMVRACDTWDFESHQYFGSDGLEVQKTRVVKRMPKKNLNKNVTNAYTHVYDKYLELPRRQGLLER